MFKDRAVYLISSGLNLFLGPAVRMHVCMQEGMKRMASVLKAKAEVQTRTAQQPLPTPALLLPRFRKKKKKCCPLFVFAGSRLPHCGRRVPPDD